MQGKQWKHPGSPPPKTFKRVHSAGKAMASIFWDSQGVIMIDYLELGHTTNRRIKAATPGNRKKEVRKTDARYSAFVRQCPCRHVTSCNDYCD